MDIEGSITWRLLKMVGEVTEPYILGPEGADGFWSWQAEINEFILWMACFVYTPKAHIVRFNLYAALSVWYPSKTYFLNVHLSCHVGNLWSPQLHSVTFIKLLFSFSGLVNGKGRYCVVSWFICSWDNLTPNYEETIFPQLLNYPSNIWTRLHLAIARPFSSCVTEKASFFTNLLPSPQFTFITSCRSQL